MSLSISLADVWKIFNASKKEKREQIATWLDGVAVEARELAETWTETFQSLVDGTATDEVKRTAYHELHTPYNIVPYSRLREFYQTASQVIGGRVERDIHDSFAHALGSVITERELALEAYKTILQQFGGMHFFVDDSNTGENIRDLGRVVQIMNREAAALEVLAKNFRASG